MTPSLAADASLEKGQKAFACVGKKIVRTRAAAQPAEMRSTSPKCLRMDRRVSVDGSGIRGGESMVKQGSSGVLPHTKMAYIRCI